MPESHGLNFSQRMYIYAGCALGEARSQLVSRHQWVRIISGGSEPASEWCERTCQCGDHGHLHRCTDVTCLRHVTQCYLPHAPAVTPSTIKILLTLLIILLMILMMSFKTFPLNHNHRRCHHHSGI